jgi:hypothetical protein
VIGPFLTGVDIDGDPFIVSVAAITAILSTHEHVPVIIVTGGNTIAVQVEDDEKPGDTLNRWIDLLRMAAEAAS